MRSLLLRPLKGQWQWRHVMKIPAVLLTVVLIYRSMLPAELPEPQHPARHVNHGVGVRRHGLRVRSRHSNGSSTHHSAHGPVGDRGHHGAGHHDAGHHGAGHHGAGHHGAGHHGSGVPTHSGPAADHHRSETELPHHGSRGEKLPLQRRPSQNGAAQHTSHGGVAHGDHGRAAAGGHGGDHVRCGLPICNFHGPQAPRLYISELTDGCGHRLVNVLDGLAFSKKHGMNFGGVLRNMHDPKKSSMGAHGHEFGQVVEDYFGAGSAAELLIDPYLRPQLHLQKLHGNWEIERFLQHIRVSKNVYIFVTLMQNKVLAPPSTYFTPDFRTALKSSLGPWKIKFAPNRPSVALHLRRGDLKNSNPLVTKDTFYFTIVDHIKRLLPTADVHVFSSTEGVWQPSDFDSYRDRGMEVHLDDDNLVEPLAHFSRADVFVMAKSTFSYSASLANLNCVVYHGDRIVAFPNFRDRMLPGWVDGDLLHRGDATGLEGCLKRAGIGGHRPAA